MPGEYDMGGHGEPEPPPELYEQALDLPPEQVEFNNPDIPGLDGGQGEQEMLQPDAIEEELEAAHGTGEQDPGADSMGKQHGNDNVEDEPQRADTERSDGMPPDEPPPPSHPSLQPDEEPQREDAMIRENLEELEHLRELIDTVLRILQEKATLSEAMEGLLSRRFDNLEALQNTTFQAIQQAQTRRELNEREQTLLEEVGQLLNDPEWLKEREDKAPKAPTWVEQTLSDLGITDTAEIETPAPPPDLEHSMRSLPDLSAIRARMQSRTPSSMLADLSDLKEILSTFEQEIKFLRQVDPRTAQELESDFTDTRARIVVRGTLLDEEQFLIQNYFSSHENQDRRNTRVNPFKNTITLS